MRMSEVLDTKAVILESQGQVAQKDIDNAYAYFGIDPAHATFILEDHILDTYRARLLDLDLIEQSTAKENLRIIAHSIDSDKLRAAISQSKSCSICLHCEVSNLSIITAIETYAQALSFLGAEEDTADDFISSLAHMRVRL